MSWKSKKHHVISRHSDDLEYRAMVQPVYKLMWIHQLLTIN